MIWMPWMMTDTIENKSAAIMIDRGIDTSTAASFGTNARSTKIVAIANAIRRLVTPVIAARPTFEADVFVPTAPARPERTVAAPSANTPPFIEDMSGRTHSASFVRWQIVITPSAFIAAARAAIANGTVSPRSNDQETWPSRGTSTQAAATTASLCAVSKMPAIAAAM